MAAGHVGGGPGFVDEHQAAGVERRLAANEDPPLFGYVGPIPGLRRGRPCSAARKLFF
jgi:hypothetical protein